MPERDKALHLGQSDTSLFLYYTPRKLTMLEATVATQCQTALRPTLYQRATPWPSHAQMSGNQKVGLRRECGASAKTKLACANVISYFLVATSVFDRILQHNCCSCPGVIVHEAVFVTRLCCFGSVSCYIWQYSSESIRQGWTKPALQNIQRPSSSIVRQGQDGPPGRDTL